MRRVVALSLVVLCSCSDDFSRPDDPCALQANDSTCWSAVDDAGESCALIYVGDSCGGHAEPLGCFGSEYSSCTSDEDCPPAYECVEVDVTTCAPGPSGGTCLACGTTPRGVCRAE
ncbi:MAG: hypothetical protein HOW73_09395 [Polyangiaceae bacterium]|nr:hypothetical protein [Polyangiaceae bacterium]